MKAHAASEKRVPSQLKDVVVVEREGTDGKEYQWQAERRNTDEPRPNQPWYPGTLDSGVYNLSGMPNMTKSGIEEDPYDNTQTGNRLKNS